MFFFFFNTKAELKIYTLAYVTADVYKNHIPTALYILDQQSAITLICPCVYLGIMPEDMTGSAGKCPHVPIRGARWRLEVGFPVPTCILARSIINLQ
jgi:hypothetical protein